MRFARALCLSVTVICCGMLRGQSLLPEVQEQQLKNGLRIFLVQRPGAGAVHARLFLNGGSADTGTRPAAASLLMARCVFSPPGEGELRNAKGLESQLKKEEGTFEALRLERVKQARHPGTEPIQEAAGLELLEQQAYERVQDLLGPASVEPLGGVPAVHRDLAVEADQIALGMDLPKDSFEPYCRFLADRLNAPLLARFPLERNRLLQKLKEDDGSEQKALDILLSAALPGQPYAQIFDVQSTRVESITWSDLRAFTRRAVAPNRLFLVLVGDLRMPEALSVLERTLGGLRPYPQDSSSPDEAPLDLSMEPGARRLQASLPGDKRLFLSWRIPPITHSDRLGLQVLVQLLGGGKTSRLPDRLQGDRTLTEELSVRANVPGGRDTNLLVIEAKPSERHELSEVEQVIQGELIRVQRGTFQEGEIRRAQRQVEVHQLMVQEDAAELAQALGTALCQGGDWRLAFNSLQVKRDLTPQEVQGIALKYLAPGRSVIAYLEPDPIFAPQDHLEDQLVKVLTRILEAKLENPGQAQSVVREAIRQLRMLPRAEREQTLKLLESQVKP